MKILHICAIPATAKILLQPQLKYLLSHNLVVGIACSPGEELSELQQKGFKVHPVQIDRKISPLANLQSIYNLVTIIRDNQYDLVHVHTPIAAVLGRIAAKIAGVNAIVYTSHGLPFHDLSSPFQYRFYSTVEKLTASITDLILSQNHEDIDMAIKIGMCSPTKLGYLGNGIDVNRFRRSSIAPSHQVQLRKSFGISDASLLVGTIGRLTRKKGAGYLIEAAAKLIPQFPNLQIMIIGGELSTDPEPFQTELLERICTLGIENHVTFTGDRDDIPELLSLLDIFTLPTFTHEGLPRSILEAMAMELPVVATNIRGCREAVVNGETGLIIPPQDSDSLVEALGKLLSNPELRKAYGEVGRKRIEKEYDEDLVFERLANFYQKMGLFILDNNPVCA
jgi:glycosyltransferase involved in cell wall biosynthesis